MAVRNLTRRGRARGSPTPVGSAAAILLAVLLVTADPAGAEPAPGNPEPLGLGRYGLKGQAVLKPFVYFRETPNDDALLFAEGIVQLEWARRLAEWGRLKLVGEARKDTDGFAEGVELRIPDTRRRRSVLDLKEAEVGALAGPLEATLGKQVFAWGTADAYNPTDNLNPYDYLDVIDNEKMAVYSVASRLSVGPTTLALVLAPFFTPSRLPLRDSRWTPLLPAAALDAVVEDRQLPPTTLENMQYAGRLRTTLGGWDLSASYFEGFEHTPVFRTPVEDAGLDTTRRFTPVFTRLRAIGVDFSTTVRQFEVHGEQAVKLVVRNGRDDRFQGMWGINYTVDDPGFFGLDQVVLTLEYGREVILESRPESGIVPAGDAPVVGDLLANNAFRNGVAGRVTFRFGEETEVKLSGTADFTGAASYYAQLKLTHRLRDGLEAEAGLDVIAGPTDSFWGRWRDNDRLFFRLKQLF